MKEIVLSGTEAEHALNAVKKLREKFPLLNCLSDGEILRALVFIGMGGEART